MFIFVLSGTGLQSVLVGHWDPTLALWVGVGRDEARAGCWMMLHRGLGCFTVGLDDVNRKFLLSR